MTNAEEEMDHLFGDDPSANQAVDPPKSAFFTARQMPDGKWRLTKGDVSMGVFESPAECESAIHRIIVPNVRYYNADGELIN